MEKVNIISTVFSRSQFCLAAAARGRFFYSFLALLDRSVQEHWMQKSKRDDKWTEVRVTHKYNFLLLPMNEINSEVLFLLRVTVPSLWV